MGDCELLGRAVIDELLVQQPVNGALVGSSIPEGVPRRDEVGMMVIDLGLEASERFSPLKRVLQASPGRDVADAVSEVGHVLVPDVRRERIDGHQVQLIDVDWVLPVDGPPLAE